MKVVSNKSQRPLSVPLPRGKKLHLGPGKTGEISSKDAEHPALLKLVEAGQLEILGEGERAHDVAGGSKIGRGSAPGHTPGSSVRSSGDR
jgi:hypothetical protein